MKTLALTLAIGVLSAGPASAQTPPAAGLAAEGESRWDDALRIYRDLLDRTPQSPELWQRVADIEGRLGRPHEVIIALQRAAAAAPSDAERLSRLSQAHAAQGQVIPALLAIEGALALKASSDEYLRAHATLATWAGEYAAAAASYRKLREANPQEGALALALARVSVWNGSSDAAANVYREYLESPDAAPEVWLELARTESWRGNLGAALAALENYQQRFGQTDAYLRERVAILARGGHPREALRELEPLLAVSPLDFDLNLSRAIALASARRHGAALSSLSRAGTLKPQHADVRAAESLVRTLLGSSVGPSTTFYNDSDGVQIMTVTPRFDVGFRSDTRLHGGYEHVALQARNASGLEQVSGRTSAMMDHVWTGLSQRVGAFTLGATIGQARSESHELNTYGVLLQFVPVDSFVTSVERSSGFAPISPRAAGLGLSRVMHRAQVDWTPTMASHMVIDASYESLSDGNARWQVFVSPRAALTRSQRINVDVGLLLHQFGASKNLDNGYYDPQRYEYYSVVLSPYWKVSDNVGVSISAGLGGQRDDSAEKFRLGRTTSIEATFGIYQRWLVKVHGSTTNNRRLDSGAFSGTSGGVVLQRRF